MKKTLMAGTAIVASGMLLATAPVSAAEKIKLSLGGYMEQWFGYSEEDSAFVTANTSANSLDQKSDAEIHFKGQTTLDNGIKVGVKFELEGDSDEIGTSSAFDEAMIFLSGSFGRINIGKEDTASELMGYGAPSVGPVGLNKSDANDWVRQPAGNSANNTHSMDLGMSDKNNLTYFSPRIAGVQFGATYTPEVTEEKDTKNTSSVDHQGYSLGVNYVTKLNKANVAVYAAYAAKEDADLDGGGKSNPAGWGVGGEVGFGAFTIGAGYIVENDTTTDTTWNVGVEYKMGANAFSLGYQVAEDTAGTGSTTDDSGKIIALGYERTLGPGVTWGSSIAKADWDGEGTGAGEDNDGYMFVTGVKVAF